MKLSMPDIFGTKDEKEEPEPEVYVGRDFDGKERQALYGNSGFASSELTLPMKDFVTHYEEPEDEPGRGRTQRSPFVVED